MHFITNTWPHKIFFFYKILDYKYDMIENMFKFILYVYRVITADHLGNEQQFSRHLQYSLLP